MSNSAAEQWLAQFDAEKQARAAKQAQREADEHAEWDSLCRRLGINPAHVPLDDWEALRRAALPDRSNEH